MITRIEQYKKIFSREPRFRLKQIERALFDPKKNNWQDISTLSKNMRNILEEKNIPWLSYKKVKVIQGKNNDACKALLELNDGENIETVLIRNNREQWTICVSSQVGCAMGCAFCSTGAMGLRRNLTSDEIIDQYRFWSRYISKKNFSSTRISNIVFMGMGEPLKNYENVKYSIQSLLANTDIGPYHVTVSTVGIIPELNALLKDEHWPAVRMAISLHSADPLIRKRIMPSSHEAFLQELEVWARQFLKKYPQKRSYITFEYILLQGINDSKKDAAMLVKYISNIGKVKVNLIPYNSAEGMFGKSSDMAMNAFQSFLRSKGIMVTCRKSLGADIHAACGQLSNKTKNNP